MPNELHACKTKKPYPTESAARLSGYDAVLRRNVKALFTYPCAYCGNWHLSGKQGDSARLPAITAKGPFDGQ